MRLVPALLGSGQTPANDDCDDRLAVEDATN